MSEEDAIQRRVGRGHLTREEAAAVERFRGLAEAYESPNGDDYDDAAILADPRWHAVVHAAQKAKQRLLPLLKEPAERDALLQPLHWGEDSRG